MCIVASVAPDSLDFLADIRVPIMVETLLYRSAERKVLVSCDLIACNHADRHVELFLTHPDDVEGRLATEDWFASPQKGDERRELVRRIYGPYWEVDSADRSLRFSNPTRSPVGAFNPDERLKAKALSFRPVPCKDGSFQVDPQHLYLDAEYLSTYRLRNYPQVTRSSQDRPRPFSSFCLTLPPGATVFARLSVFIENQAYHRLIETGHALGFSRFAVIGPDGILNQLQRELKNSDPKDPCADFVAAIGKGRVSPQRYHVILGQPDIDRTDNQLVRVRPTSSVIRELYIPDDEARESALWFDTDSNDFRIDLAYQERKQGQRRSRLWFYKRLPPVSTS